MSSRTVALSFTAHAESIEAIEKALDQLRYDQHEAALQSAERYIAAAVKEGIGYGDPLIVRAFEYATNGLIDTRGRAAMNGNHAPGRFREVAIGALEFLKRDYPTPRGLFGDVMCAGDFGVLYGKPGCGKTWIGAGVGISLTRRTSYLGLPTSEQGGRVGFLELELHAKKLQDRVRVMLDQVPHDPHLNDFEIVSRPDFKGVVNLLDNADFDGLHDWITGSKLDMLVIDALSRVHSVNENDATDFGPVLARCDRLRYETGCTVLLIHHEPKGNTHGKDARDDIDALRGTSRLSSDPNVLMRVVKMPGGKMRALRFVKVNGAKEPDPIYFMLDEVTGIPALCDPPAVKGEQNREKVRLVLEAAGEAGLSGRELADKVGMSKSTVAIHAKVLGATVVGSGRGSKYRLSSQSSDMFTSDDTSS